MFRVTKNHLKKWATPIVGFGFTIGVGYNTFIRSASYIMIDDNAPLWCVGLANILSAPFIIRTFALPIKRISPKNAFALLCIGITLCSLHKTHMMFLIAGSLLGCWGTSIIETLSGHHCLKKAMNKKEKSLFKGRVALGYRMGSITSKTLLLLIANSFGWALSFLFVFFPLLLSKISFSQKNWEETAHLSKTNHPLKILKSKKNFCFFALLFLTPNYMYEAMIIPFIKSQGFSWTDIALCKGSVGVVAALLGTKAAMYICQSKHTIKGTFFSLFGCGASHILAVLLTGGTKSLLFLNTLFFLANFFHGCNMGLFLILSVMFSENYKNYDVFMSISYIAFSLGGALGGFCANSLSWRAFFLLSGALPILCGFILKHNSFHVKHFISEED